jgi:hypothetical protein
MSKTINCPSGAYITLHDTPPTFAIQLHRYGNVRVVLDKKVIPELILHLQEMQDEPTRKQSKC